MSLFYHRNKCGGKSGQEFRLEKWPKAMQSPKWCCLPPYKRLTNRKWVTGGETAPGERLAHSIYSVRCTIYITYTSTLKGLCHNDNTCPHILLKGYSHLGKKDFAAFCCSGGEQRGGTHSVVLGTLTEVNGKSCTCAAIYPQKAAKSYIRISF